MDKVVLKDLSIFARHGLFDAEAKLGQRFFIDVEIGADLSVAEERDDAGGTIDWADLVETVTAAFTKRRYKLVEAAANAVAAAVFAKFAIAETVRVEIRKPSAPIEGSSPTRRSWWSGNVRAFELFLSQDAFRASAICSTPISGRFRSPLRVKAGRAVQQKLGATF